MKKLRLLVMPLMSVSLLASCGGDEPGPTPEDVAFSIQEPSATLVDNKAVIHLNWTPTGHSIECSDFTFTLKDHSDVTSTVTPGAIGSRPLELAITFNGKLDANDTGDLKFHFNDKTAKKEGEKKIEGIDIKLAPVYVDKAIRVTTTFDTGRVVEQLYEYDEEYRITKDTENTFNPDGLLFRSEVKQYTYNEYGDTISFIQIIDSSLYQGFNYTYEYSEGETIQIKKGFYFNPVAVINDKHVFTYDDQNRLTSEYVYDNSESNIDPKEHTVYTYESNYQAFKTMEYYGGGTLEHSSTNTFDDKGRIVFNKEVFDGFNGETTNEYDDFDCLVHQKIVDSVHGTTTESTTNYYKNIPTKPSHQETSMLGTVQAITIHDYTYDSHDRIKEEIIDETYGNTKTVRTINYYYEAE